MAEVPTDDTDVYDILFPSPPALKDIVAISIALRLWCQEINSHRIKNTLDKLDLRGNIFSSDSMPRIPSMILSTIEKYVKRAGVSIKLWLTDYYYPQLSKTEIFNDFIGFVADFDGSIHYVRTAKRFVRCDKIDALIRFRIACKYCFEDDIVRIWPLVSSHDSLKSENVSTYSNTELNYWIFRLKNQLYKLPRSVNHGRSVEEEMLCRTITPYGTRYITWSFVEYFWNRIDSDTRIRVITYEDLCMHRPYRYLLGKFNEVELEKFANTKGWHVIHDLLRTEMMCYSSITTCDKSYFETDVLDRAPFIMEIWTYVKEKMNGGNFFVLIQKIIRQYGRLRISTPICCELWNTAPEHLKSNAIQQLLPANSLARALRNEVRGANIDGVFLLTVLSDASAEDKNTFWNTHWSSLFNRMFADEYDQLMRLCFSSDENEIVEFKRNSLIALPNVQAKCVRLLKDLSLEELNKFLRFCYPDEQTRRSIQMNLLVDEFKVEVKNITKVSPLLNDFINDAYDDVNLANDYKTQLLYSPSTKEKFTELVNFYNYDYKLQPEGNFIDILSPSQQVARDLKKLYFFPLLQQKLVSGNFRSKIEENEFSNFISECASNEDEIAELKASISADEVVQSVIRIVMYKSGVSNYNSLLVNFLEWYFITPQERDEFKARYAEDDMFVKMITRSE